MLSKHIVRSFLFALALTATTTFIQNTDVYANPTSVTTCTENALGDQTCTTVTTTTTTTPGTTTGNVLTNSTFGTGTDPNETTTTNGWSGDEQLHTHGMFGQNMGNPANGQDITGGVYAFEGDPADNVYQDTDLVGDGHLTKSQINEGFTSTQSADIWFWNSLKNTLTIKQTITDSDGNVTTQTRVIVDHDPTRSTNGGSWSNETNVYTHSANTANDITIRAEMYNDTDGTTYDGYHRGPDVDNFELSITTAGGTSSSSTSSTVVTLCADRTPPTCTTAGDDVADAIEEIGDAVTGDDGQSIDQSIETIVENEIINVNPVIEEVYIVQTVIAVEDDFGAVEDLTVQDFVQESFTAIIEEEGLQEEFQDALSDEGITEQEFFEAVANEMEQEFAESGVENITSTNTDPLPVIEETPVEETAVEETAVEETAVEETAVEEAPAETETVNTTEESVETETEPTESEPSTETSSEPETSETETESTESETESSENEATEQEESNSDDEQSVEDSNEEASTDEQDSADTSVDTDSVGSEVSEIQAKVERIIKKLESKLKTLDQKLKVISIVTAKAMIDEQPDMTQYTSQQFYDTRTIPDNDNWYAEDTILNAYSRSIYQDKTLVAYQRNDPMFKHNEAVNKVNNTISRLQAELEVLKNENNR